MTEWLTDVLRYAYAVELFQLAVTTIGVPSAVIGTIDAWRDRQFVRRLRKHHGVGDDEFHVAHRNFREELIRLTIHLVFLANGLVSVTHAPPAPGLDTSDDRYFQIWFTRTAMAYASAALTYKSLQDNRDRKILRRRIRG